MNFSGNTGGCLQVIPVETKEGMLQVQLIVGSLQHKAIPLSSAFNFC